MADEEEASPEGDEVVPDEGPGDWTEVDEDGEPTVRTCKYQPKKKKVSYVWGPPKPKDLYPTYSPCPHLFFRHLRENFQRDGLTREDWIEILSKPRPSPWERTGPNGQKLIRYRRKPLTKRLKQLAVPRIPLVQANWEAYKGVMSDDIVERLRKILAEDFHMTPAEIRELLRRSKLKERKERKQHKRRKRRRRKSPPPPEPSPVEFVQSLVMEAADQATVIAEQRRPPSGRLEVLISTILERLAELSGEAPPPRTATGLISRLMILMAEKLAHWVESVVCEAECLPSECVPGPRPPCEPSIDFLRMLLCAPTCAKLLRGSPCGRRKGKKKGRRKKGKHRHSLGGCGCADFLTCDREVARPPPPPPPPPVCRCACMCTQPRRRRRGKKGRKKGKKKRVSGEEEEEHEEGYGEEEGGGGEEAEAAEGDAGEGEAAGADGDGGEAEGEAVAEPVEGEEDAEDQQGGGTDTVGSAKSSKGSKPSSKAGSSKASSKASPAASRSSPGASKTGSAPSKGSSGGSKSAGDVPPKSPGASKTSPPASKTSPGSSKSKPPSSASSKASPGGSKGSPGGSKASPGGSKTSPGGSKTSPGGSKGSAAKSKSKGSDDGEPSFKVTSDEDGVITVEKQESEPVAEEGEPEAGGEEPVAEEGEEEPTGEIEQKISEMGEEVVEEAIEEGVALAEEGELPNVTFGAVLRQLSVMIEDMPEGESSKRRDKLKGTLEKKFTELVEADETPYAKDGIEDVVENVADKVATWMDGVIREAESRLSQASVAGVVQSKEVREWADWITGALGVAEDWAGWISTTVADAEERAREKRGEARTSSGDVKKLTRAEWMRFREEVRTMGTDYRQKKAEIKIAAQAWETRTKGRTVVSRRQQPAPPPPDLDLLQETEEQVIDMEMTNTPEAEPEAEPEAAPEEEAPVEEAPAEEEVAAEEG